MSRHRGLETCKGLDRERQTIKPPAFSPGLIQKLKVNRLNIDYIIQVNGLNIDYI